MGYSYAARNAMLDSLATVAVYVSLHDSNPGDNGGGEISGGSPAYARKAVTWAASHDGEMFASNQPLFNVPTGTTVRYVGYWSASSGGTFYGFDDVTETVFSSQGYFRVTPQRLDLNASDTGILLSFTTGRYAVAATVAPTIEMSSMEVTPSAAWVVNATIDPGVTILTGVNITPPVAWTRAFSVDPSVSTGYLIVTPNAGYAVSYSVDPSVVHGSLNITPTAVHSVTYTVAPSVAMNLTVSPSAGYALNYTVNPTVTIGGGAPTAVSDNFNRANGGLGTNWTTITGKTAAEIESNRLSTSQDDGMYWSADTFADDQYATLKMETSNYLRMRADGTNIYIDSSTDGSSWTNRCTVTSESSISSGSAGFAQADMNSMYPGPAVRISSSAETYYGIYFTSQDMGEGWFEYYYQICKVISGTVTTLGTSYKYSEGESQPYSLLNVDDWTGGDL